MKAAEAAKRKAEGLLQNQEHSAEDEVSELISKPGKVVVLVVVGGGVGTYDAGVFFIVGMCCVTRS